MAFAYGLRTHADVADENSATGSPDEGRSAAVIGLSGLLLSATLWAAFQMFIAPMSVGRCGDKCDYDTLAATLQTFFILAALPLIVAIMGTVLLRKCGRWMLAATIAGFVVLSLLVGITYNVARAAMLL